MHTVARGLNKLTGGKLTPNTVTIVGLLAHLPIAWLIATDHNLKAAGLLLIFGLFDTLDGELARLQGRASHAGMVLDASTDRLKEVMLYTGVAFSIVHGLRPFMVPWVVVACGASLAVSYIKAKGEVAIASSNLTLNEVNYMFADGLGRFEVRMAILFVGLVSNRLILAVIAISILSIVTALYRLIVITKKLNAKS